MVQATLAEPRQSNHFEMPAFWESRSDQELLRLFVEERNGAAFAAIVHRHGPMVLGVCRRVLHDGHDAEDAFQAAFLVLVHKARSMRDPQSLASWLHGVALRTAQHNRAQDARRCRREMEAAKMSSVDRSGTGKRWAELRERLDAELNALPEKYRAPLVLCYLEGKTHTEAAQLLGWPTGSISARVAKGRDLLRRRLAGRDRELQACIIPFLLGCSMYRSPVRSELVQDTVAAALAVLPGEAEAAAVIPSAIGQLTKAGLRSPFRIRSSRILKLLLAAVVALASFGAAAYAISSSNVFGAHKISESGQDANAAAPPRSCH
jgi:RNA polymerase sigma factor (sigma-70 family)